MSILIRKFICYNINSELIKHNSLILFYSKGGFKMSKKLKMRNLVAIILSAVIGLSLPLQVSAQNIPKMQMMK